MPVYAGFRSAGAAMVLALAVAGCEPPRIAPASDGITSDRQLQLRPWAPEPQAVPGPTGKAPYADQLTLGSAVRRVLAYSPAIKAAFLEIEAKRGEEAQSAVKPNPELLFELENFGGSNKTQAFDSAE